MNNSNKIIQYKNNEIKIISHSNENKVCDIRFEIILPYIKEFLISSGIKEIEFGIFLGDTYDKSHHNMVCDYKIPHLAFSKHKEYTPGYILIPSVDFFTNVIRSCFSAITYDILFSEKSNSSIFAGANTNGYKRIEYCDKVKNLHQHIGLLTHVQMDNQDILSRYPDYDKLLGSCSIKEQLRHKVVVNIDGNGLCWSRLYWQMASNSVPVYIDRKDYLEQYFDKFDDSECYFNATMDNFEEVYDYILDPKNIDHVNQVNENGKKFIRTHFTEYMKNPQLFLLNSVKEAIKKVAEQAYH